MLIYERLDESGKSTALHLVRDQGQLMLVTGETRAAIPARVLLAIMRRYGRELDPAVELEGEELELEDGLRLRRFRFHARVDAEGRDYLALLEDRKPAIGAMATTVAGALEHLLAAR